MVHGLNKRLLTQFIREIENKDSPVRPIGVPYSRSETKNLVQARAQTLPASKSKLEIVDQ